MKKISIKNSALLLLVTLFGTSSSIFADAPEERTYEILVKFTVNAKTKNPDAAGGHAKMKVGGELNITPDIWSYFDFDLTKFTAIQQGRPFHEVNNKQSIFVKKLGTTEVLRVVDRFIASLYLEKRDVSGNFALKFGKMQNKCSGQSLIGIALETPLVEFWFDGMSFCRALNSRGKLIGTRQNGKIKVWESNKFTKNPMASFLLTFKPEKMTVKVGINVAKGDYWYKKAADDVSITDSIMSYIAGGHVAVNFGKKNALAGQIKKVKFSWVNMCDLKDKKGKLIEKPGIFFDMSFVPVTLFNEYKAQMGVGIEYRMYNNQDKKLLKPSFKGDDGLLSGQVVLGYKCEGKIKEGVKCSLHAITGYALQYASFNKTAGQANQQGSIKDGFIMGFELEFKFKQILLKY